MATVEFFEKPGCINNTRQKRWLAASGHTVIARDLLKEKWTPERLRPFFGCLPVAQWFNVTAPRVKSGEVVPERLTEDQAVALMVGEPLLIRRPLMQVDDRQVVGFSPEFIAAWIGLSDEMVGEDVETCVRQDLEA